MRRALLVVAAVALLASAALAVNAQTAELAEPTPRDPLYMQQAAADLGLVEVTAAADAESEALEREEASLDAAEELADAIEAEQEQESEDAALLEFSPSFIMDEEDAGHRVLLEAGIKGEAEAEGPIGDALRKVAAKAKAKARQVAGQAKAKFQQAAAQAKAKVRQAAQQAVSNLVNKAKQAGQQLAGKLANKAKLKGQQLAAKAKAGVQKVAAKVLSKISDKAKSKLGRNGLPAAVVRVAPKETMMPAGLPTTAAELLPVRREPLPGELPLADSFYSKGQAEDKSAPEKPAVLAARMDAAKKHLKALAAKEHVEEFARYQRRLGEVAQLNAEEMARRSSKFARPVPEAQAFPHPGSNAATRRGDRVHNTLFPAATPKSDNKAASQEHDFHHRGNGDSFANHASVLVEHSASANAVNGHAHGEEVVEEVVVEQPAAADAVVEEVAEAPAADGAAVEEVVEGAADGSAEVPAEAPATPAAAPAAAPSTPVEPCSAQCDVAGGWRTAACQDCIVRGMVNGWIVKSIAEQQQGYNYLHYARNQCVAYANELNLRSTPRQGAPFSQCFFQKVHESCNL